MKSMGKTEEKYTFCYGQEVKADRNLFEKCRRNFGHAALCGEIYGSGSGMDRKI